MNEILFLIGDWPVRIMDALIVFGALALILLLAMVIVIARSGRRGAELAMAQAIRADELEERLSEILRAQSEQTGRTDAMGAGAGRPPGRDGARGQRAARFGHPSRRPVDGSDHAQHHGLVARAARAARHHRQRAQEPHRPDLASDDAARRARQQAVARRVRPGADGGDRPGRHAEGFLRIPVHALDGQAAGLRGVPAGPAPALHRREISAGSDDRAARRPQR